MPYQIGQEGQVYYCTWKKRGKQWVVWLPDDPQIQVAGLSYVEIEERLRELVEERYDDSTPIFEFNPSLPLGPLEARFARRGFLTVSGPNDCFTWQNKDSTLFTDGTCAICKYGEGLRSSEPLVVPVSETSADGAFAAPRGLGPGGRESIYVFSAEFVEASTQLGLLPFKWRELIAVPATPPPPLKLEGFDFVKVRERPRKKLLKRFFEPVGESLCDYVFVRGLEIAGWHCSQCGRTTPTRFVNSARGIFLSVAEERLPKAIPPAFLVGPVGEQILCVTSEAWQRLLSARKWKGLTTSPVWAVPRDFIETKPNLQMLEPR